MKTFATFRTARFPIAVLCAALLVASGVTAAVAADPPHTDPVEGTFSFTTVQLKQRVCLGQDGAYADITVKQVGVATGDPRVSGNLELTSHILLNATTGLGISEGRFTVRDASTGAKKTTGDFHGVITPDPPLFQLNGLLIGTVLDEGTGTDEDGLGRGRVIANLEATFDTHLNGTGEFGGLRNTPLRPAVIQDGHCTKGN